MRNPIESRIDKAVFWKSMRHWDKWFKKYGNQMNGNVRMRVMPLPPITRNYFTVRDACTEWFEYYETKT